jgi:outer membrane immunogenic protein
MTLTKLLRTSAAALGALAVASTGAHAADIYSGGMKEPPAYIPPPLWTGFYIGAHIGAAWDQFSKNTFNMYDCALGWDCTQTISGVTYYDNPAIMRDRFENEALAFGGGQLGYNYQWYPSWVVGIEVDLGGMSVAPRREVHGNTYWTDGSGNVVGVGTPFMIDGDGGQSGFYGDVTGRLGWTWGPAMIYAKGGFAWLEANNNMRESIWDGGNLGCGPGWCTYGNNNNNDYVTGWTVGGGVEWKVSPSWSIKAEYLHFEFNNNNNNCCNDFFTQYYAQYGYSVNNFRNNVTLDVDTVKLGFNYFWNPAPPAPLK